MSKLTNDEVSKFLEKAGASAQCNLCGQNNWLLNEDDTKKTVGLFIPRDDGGYVMPGGIVPAIALICKNCGNVRLHARGLIEQKVAKATDTGETDDQ